MYRYKSIVLVFWVAFWAIVGAMVPFGADISYATQTDIDYSKNCLGTDTQGYNRIRVVFLHDQQLCWTENNENDNTWRYGDTASWDYHLRAYNLSFGTSNAPLLPDLPSELSWTDNPSVNDEHCETFLEGENYDFYIADTNYAGNYQFKMGDDNSVLSVDNLNSYDYITFAFAGGSQGGNWYQEPNIYWDPVCSYTGYEPDITVNSPTESSEWDEPVSVDLDYENATGYDVLRLYIVGENASGIGIMTQSKTYNITGDSGSITTTFSGLPVGFYLLSGQFWNSTSGSNVYAQSSREFEVIQYIPSYGGTDLEPDDLEPPIVYDADSYYGAYSSYTTPTSLYTIMTDPVNSLANWISEKLSILKVNFSNDIADEQGEKMADGLQVMRYYINIPNSVMGGFPFGDLMIVVLFLTLLVAIVKIIIAIRRLF